MIDSSDQYETAIREIYAKVNEIERVIFRGNGTPSLIVQITNLQNQINTLDENVDVRIQALTDTINAKFAHMNTNLSQYNTSISEVNNKLTKHISDSEDVKNNAATNRTAIIVACIACIGSILASVSTVLFAH